MKRERRDTAGSRYRIGCRYAPEVLVPSEAIERAFYENARPWTEDRFVTEDGKECGFEFVASWMEPSDKALDDLCMEKWDMKFGMVRSLWYDRLKLRYGLKSWHYIRLHELG